MPPLTPYSHAPNLHTVTLPANSILPTHIPKSHTITRRMIPDPDSQQNDPPADIIPISHIFVQSFVAHQPIPSYIIPSLSLNTQTPDSQNLLRDEVNQIGGVQPAPRRRWKREAQWKGVLTADSGIRGMSSFGKRGVVIEEIKDHTHVGKKIKFAFDDLSAEVAMEQPRRAQ